MLEDDKLSLSQELAREKHNLASAKEKCGSFERELESKERKHRQEVSRRSMYTSVRGVVGDVVLSTQ